MKSFDPRRSGIRDRVRSHLINSKKNAHLQENLRKQEQLQQAALLCKLFGKQVKLSWLDDTGFRHANTSVYLTTPRTVILRDGRYVPLEQIISIEML
jgi:hypothetical protein